MTDIVPHLADLARKINIEHQQARDALRAGLEHARNAGQLLLEAKRQCPHGRWLPWLKANVECSERTAQAYMQVAKRWGELEAKAQGLADLTFEGGLKLLAKRGDRDGDSQDHTPDADGKMSEGEFDRRLRSIKQNHRRMLSAAALDIAIRCLAENIPAEYFDRKAEADSKQSDRLYHRLIAKHVRRLKASR